MTHRRMGVALSLWAMLPGASPALAADDWTICMTAAKPARVIVDHCTVVLKQTDLSSFHRFLLVSARGDADVRLGRYQDAVRDYTLAIRLDPVEDDTYASRGVAYENLNQFAAAERDYGEAISRYLAQPNNRTNGTLDVLANDYALRGRVRLEMGRTAEALGDLQLATKTYPAGMTAQARSLLRQAAAAAKP